MGPQPVRGPSNWLQADEPAEEIAEDSTEESVEEPMELGGIQVDRNKYPALQRNVVMVDSCSYKSGFWRGSRK